MTNWIRLYVGSFNVLYLGETVISNHDTLQFVHPHESYHLHVFKAIVTNTQLPKVLAVTKVQYVELLFVATVAIHNDHLHNPLVYVIPVTLARNHHALLCIGFNTSLFVSLNRNLFIP